MDDLTFNYHDELINKQARKPGLRGRINAKCAECIYDPLLKGTWRKQVENSTSPRCPLFAVRPVTTGYKSED